MYVGVIGQTQVAGPLTGLGFADEVRLSGHCPQEQPISTSPALGLQEDASIPDICLHWFWGSNSSSLGSLYVPLPLQTTWVCYLPMVLLVKLSCLHETHILLCNIFSFYYEINLKVTPTRRKLMSLSQSFSTIPRL